ncbi:DUF1573 domain-containing protein [Odoribacter lunatus]|uniref:DUF1573 domain-containing protein n=1 Tax=Odoribacter lunatus TaxID=2941335 RepID=UPI00203CA4CA|nr:DUF1573 domain-containing protein [Odoribacter lunatus]
MNTFIIRFFILCLCCIGLAGGCRQKATTSSSVQERTTRIKFQEKHYNFGDLTEGEIVSHTFIYTNTGKENLVIKAIETGCGCTTVEYDKKPIPPGKEGKIEIAFNSSGRYGKQYKEISIFANLPSGEAMLSITANVK